MDYGCDSFGGINSACTHARAAHTNNSFCTKNPRATDRPTATPLHHSILSRLLSYFCCGDDSLALGLTSRFYLPSARKCERENLSNFWDVIPECDMEKVIRREVTRSKTELMNGPFYRIRMKEEITSLVNSIYFVLLINFLSTFEFLTLSFVDPFKMASFANSFYSTANWNVLNTFSKGAHLVRFHDKSGSRTRHCSIKVKHLYTKNTWHIKAVFPLPGGGGSIPHQFFGCGEREGNHAHFSAKWVGGKLFLKCKFAKLLKVRAF